MKRLTAATLRRTARLLRPASIKPAKRSLQKAIAGLVVASALAPFSILAPERAKAKPTAPRALPKPLGAQFLSRRHRSATGARDYRLYVPAARPVGLILMLHGCNQTPDDFARGTHMNALAEKHGLVIAYPEQPSGRNAAACWNWFKPGDQIRGAGEPALLAALARKLGREFGLGREAVFVAGLSAGGAMAAILADVYPDVFAAAGVHSGLARGSARNVLSAMTVMRKGGGATDAAPARASAHRVRRIIFHGDDDSTVHPSNAGQIVVAALGQTAQPATVRHRSSRGRDSVHSIYADASGAVALELWMLAGGGHAWSGGRPAGSYTDRSGPDASALMVRFFLGPAGLPLPS